MKTWAPDTRIRPTMARHRTSRAKPIDAQEAQGSPRSPQSPAGSPRHAEPHVARGRSPPAEAGVRARLRASADPPRPATASQLSQSSRARAGVSDWFCGVVIRSQRACFWRSSMSSTLASIWLSCRCQGRSWQCSSPLRMAPASISFITCRRPAASRGLRSTRRRPTARGSALSRGARVATRRSRPRSPVSPPGEADTASSTCHRTH